VGGFWYWAPPVARVSVRVGSPLLQIGFAWYPGRVAWIHSGGYIGWVPLAPYEPYYCYRRWGPRAIVVKKVNMTTVNINRYEYYKHAVIINQGNLYTANNYTKVRVRHISDATMVNHYRVAPVVKNTIVKNYEKISHRHGPTSVHVREKPNRPTIGTSRQGQSSPRQDIAGRTKTTRQNIADVRYDRLIKRAGAELPETKVPRAKDRLTVTNQPNRRVMEAKPYEKDQKKQVVFGSADRMQQTMKKVQEPITRMPLESVKREKTRTEDKQYTRKEVQTVHKELPQTIKQQEVRAESNKKVGKKTRRLQEEIPYRASEQAQLSGQGDQFRGKKGLRETRQNPQFHQPQLGQEKIPRAFRSYGH